MRELRLIPVVAIAAAALFVLKTSAIVIEGGYTLIASRTAHGARASARECPRSSFRRRRALEDDRGAARRPRERIVNSGVVNSGRQFLGP